MAVNVAVLGGTGQQGSGIAQRLLMAGVPVIVGSRDPGRAASAIATWQSPNRPSSTSYAQAIAASDVVVLAIPFDTAGAVIEEHRAQFKPGALVVDVTVPLAFTAGSVSLADIPEGSASEHIRSRLPAHVRLAATFKTVPAHLLTDIEQPLDCDEFVCGDSAAAREEAGALVTAVRGLRAIDVGPLVRARAIEQLTLLAITINRRRHVHAARFRVVGL